MRAVTQSPLSPRRDEIYPRPAITKGLECLPTVTAGPIICGLVSLNWQTLGDALNISLAIYFTELSNITIGQARNSKLLEML